MVIEERFSCDTLSSLGCHKDEYTLWSLYLYTWLVQLLWENHFESLMVLTVSVRRREQHLQRPNQFLFCVIPLCSSCVSCLFWSLCTFIIRVGLFVCSEFLMTWAGSNYINKSNYPNTSHTNIVLDVLLKNRTN